MTDSSEKTGPINIEYPVNFHEPPAGLVPEDMVPKSSVSHMKRRQVLGILAAGAVGGSGLVSTLGFVADRLGIVHILPDDHMRTVSDGPLLFPNWSDQTFDGDISKWAHFAGDPNANLVDRSKWKACFMSTPRKAFEDQRRQYDQAYDAVAWNPGGNMINIATLPNGLPFLAPAYRDKNNLVAGMTLGPGELRTTPGLWLPDKGMFVPAAAGAIALPQRIKQENVAQEMPGAFYM
ncbi:MAG TPA: hypothetical protein VF733_00710 [Candidatus Saccharimonadales bacterium]